MSEYKARFVAPWTPPECMWGGLARDIMMAMSFSGPLTPRSLLTFLKRIGREIPKWLTDESEMKALDHAISKGTRCVLIYRAMLWDGRALHLTPSGHEPDCDFHCEQYPHECTCGATLRRDDHGTYEQAVEYALDHAERYFNGCANFLTSWREGDLSEWPEFYDWLAEQGQ